MVLQACLDAGYALPHYCYHPGLSIPASCRICLVEVEGIPKLVPSCQTPIRDGMVVHSQIPKAVANQKQVMEYLLINHPLDCPVCDQAGECFLQDYSYEYGRSRVAVRGRQGQEAQEGCRRKHSISMPTAASCAPVACASPARSPAPASCTSTAAAIARKSTFSPASRAITNSPAMSSISAPSGRCSTRIFSSSSASGC